jgi:hypothetical protein
MGGGGGWTSLPRPWRGGGCCWVSKVYFESPTLITYNVRTYNVWTYKYLTYIVLMYNVWTYKYLTDIVLMYNVWTYKYLTYIVLMYNVWRYHNTERITSERISFWRYKIVFRFSLVLVGNIYISILGKCNNCIIIQTIPYVVKLSFSTEHWRCSLRNILFFVFSLLVFILYYWIWIFFM